jgi:hypothetical protein
MQFLSTYLFVLFEIFFPSQIDLKVSQLQKHVKIYNQLFTRFPIFRKIIFLIFRAKLFFLLFNFLLLLFHVISGSVGGLCKT